jgi:hypothetical protein
MRRDASREGLQRFRTAQRNPLARSRHSPSCSDRRPADAPNVMQLASYVSQIA